MTHESNGAEESPKEELPPELIPRFRRLETVLQFRTDRFALVLEQATDEQNEMACIRTAEALGIQTVYIVRSPDQVFIRNKSRKGVSHGIAKHASLWVTIRWFDSVTECIKGIRDDGREIWATDLSPAAELLATRDERASLRRVCDLATERGGDVPETLKSIASADDLDESLHVPRRLAVVMGRESDGVSERMLAAADKRIHIPMFGFTESFNLSVATGLVLQRLFYLCPEARGDIAEDRKSELRRSWVRQLAKNDRIRASAETLERQLAEGGHIVPIPELRRGPECKVALTPKLRRKRAPFDRQTGRFLSDPEAADEPASKRPAVDAAAAEPQLPQKE